MIGVGAVTIDGQPTSFSSGNLSVQVAAPGKSVPAQGRNGEYYTVSGTSPACALVAGVAALIKSKYPKITPAAGDGGADDHRAAAAGGRRLQRADRVRHRRTRARR